MLLCAFMAIAFFARATPADTIIVGGKYLVIEKQEVGDKEFDQQYGPEPANNKRCWLCRANINGEIGIHFREDLNFTSSATNASGFETIGSFIGKKRSYCPSYAAGLDIGIRLTRKLTLQTGFGMAYSNHCYLSFDPAKLADDTISFFLNPEKGRLDQVYIAIDNPLGGEYDTTQVDLVKGSLIIPTWQIPLGFRWNTQPEKRTGHRWYYSAALMLMMQQTESAEFRTLNPVLISAGGKWINVVREDLSITTMLIGARFSGGRTWQLWKHPQQDQYLRFSAGLTLTLPAGDINETTTYSVSLWKAGAQIGLAFAFGNPDR